MKYRTLILSLGISILNLSGCTELWSDVSYEPPVYEREVSIVPITPGSDEIELSPYQLQGDKYFSQFPEKRPATGKKVIIVDLNIPAWAAYDAEGNLVKTGKASGGKSYCPDLHHACKTVTGTYAIYSKKGSDCKSSRFPLETHGGAPMPYCMHFHKGYALHGSYDVPSYNASHGCVRLIPSSAQWLSQNFIEIGTTVIVEPYTNKGA